MHSDLESIVCKFGGDPAICLREEAIGAKVYRQTDGQTTDAAPIALTHSWNELKSNISAQTSTRRSQRHCDVDRSPAVRTSPALQCSR